MSHAIAGRDPKIREWLKLLGVNPNLARRVIIDIPHDGAVIVYIERYGSSEAFSVIPPLNQDEFSIEKVSL